MKPNHDPAKSFSLSEGGPFYAWLKKRGLLEKPLKLALAALCLAWLPLAIISAINGTFVGGTQMPFLKDVAMQARLLIALPMLVLIRPFIDNRVIVVSEYLASSLMQPDEQKEILSKTYTRAEKMTSSAWTEIIALLIVIGATVSMVRGGVYSALQGDTSWMVASSNPEHQSLSFAGYWAVFFSIPLFQFLFLRWLWRYIVWVVMLFRLSKAELNLPPTHADRACGLGVIALAQLSFNMIFVTGSVILSGQFIAMILQNPDSYNSIRGQALGYIVIALILVVFPLLFFMGKILKVKNQGLVNLSNLGVNLSRKFENEWVNDLPVDKIPTADPVNPSMIYDYGGMYDYLQDLRPVPITLRDMISIVVMLFVPFIPILFVHFSVAELVQKIAGMLV